MSRRSKKISRLHKDNKFLKYVVERAKNEIDILKQTNNNCDTCVINK